jgi:hypothetical protein
MLFAGVVAGRGWGGVCDQKLPIGLVRTAAAFEPLDSITEGRRQRTTTRRQSGRVCVRVGGVREVGR